MLLVPILFEQKIPINNIRAHTIDNSPFEIFSLYNESNDLQIDGLINLNTSDSNSEWAPASIYTLFNMESLSESKLLLQNNNSNLFIALDCVNFQTEPLGSTWGMAIYFDKDHNGLLTSSDRAVYFKDDGVDQIVSYNEFDSILNQWTEIESGSLGVELSSSKILVSTTFDNSTFNSNDHRQFEIKIPLNLILNSLTNITGFAVEAFENFDSGDEELTWPRINAAPMNIRQNAKIWGDLSIGWENWIEDYIVEENFNIDALSSPLTSGDNPFLGRNNGSFLATFDLDGNGDLELLISSNRSIVGDDYKIAIYDFVDGSIASIWHSWLSTHNSKFFLSRGIAIGDLDSDLSDEIYLVGDDSRILRLSNWNPGTMDFDNADYVYSHTTGLMGYIAIGDASNNGNLDLVFGDQNGVVSILEYDPVGDTFDHYKYSPFTPVVAGVDASRIHAIEVSDVGSDGQDEILFLSQITDDDTLSTTQLQIFERAINKKIEDNLADNLPSESSPITEDQFGHTILVEDVDNDFTTEIIIVGKNYVKIFGLNTFNEASPSLLIDINDETYPSMGGGAAVYDVDNDAENELIIGCNNGTLLILEVTDSDPDPDKESLSSSIEWLGDFGATIGKRKSIISYDIDQDGENEIIFSDSFGQIIILGKSKPPTISINSPITGQTFSSNQISVEWSGSDDLAIHHYEIYLDEILYGKVHGTQTAFRILLTNSNHIIEVVVVDINGKNSSSTVSVKYSTEAPEVTIITPENNFLTTNSILSVEYTADFGSTYILDYYEIWVNDIRVFTGDDLQFDVSLSSDGVYNITVAAFNNGGYKGTSTVFVTKDTAGPLIDITFPLSGTATKFSSVELHWSASDSLAGISHYKIEMDGNFVSNTTSKSYTVELNSDGNYFLEVFAYDLLGNDNSDSVTLTKDSIKPNVEFTSPENGLITSNPQVILYWDSNDNIGGTGIHHNEIKVNEINRYSGTEQSTTIEFGTNGIKDIVITTYDNAGNTAQDYIQVIVDTSSPHIEILSPLTNWSEGLPDRQIYSFPIRACLPSTSPPSYPDF